MAGVCSAIYPSAPPLAAKYATVSAQFRICAAALARIARADRSGSRTLTESVRCRFVRRVDRARERWPRPSAMEPPTRGIRSPSRCGWAERLAAASVFPQVVEVERIPHHLHRLPGNRATALRGGDHIEVRGRKNVRMTIAGREHATVRRRPLPWHSFSGRAASRAGL